MRSRAERTRADVLAVAEAVFAEKGFTAARLQDVAQGVGIKRASIVYYFRDKHELYDAVCDDVFGELAERYRAVLKMAGSPLARMEALISTWVAYATERRSVAPLMLREAVESLPAQRAVLARHSRAAVAATVQAVTDGQRQGLFRPIDPIHFIFAVVGATIFFLSGTPTLVPDWAHDPFSREQVNALRDEVLGIAGRLLGVRENGAGPARMLKRRNDHGNHRIAKATSRPKRSRAYDASSRG